MQESEISQSRIKIKCESHNIYLTFIYSVSGLPLSVCYLTVNRDVLFYSMGFLM